MDCGIIDDMPGRRILCVVRQHSHVHPFWVVLAVAAQNGDLMSRRGCNLPANASGVDPHRASITSRFGQVELGSGSVTHQSQHTGGADCPCRGRCVSIFIDKNRRYIGKSQSNGRQKGRHGRRNIGATLSTHS
jgi:hypothetical protein